MGPMSPKKTKAFFGRFPFLYLPLHREMKRREVRRERERERQRREEKRRREEEKR